MFTKFLAFSGAARAARSSWPPYLRPRGSVVFPPPREYPLRSPSACAARMQVADRPDDRRVVRFLAGPVRQ